SLSLSITHATRENTGSLFATPLFTCPSSAIYHSSCRQTYNSPPSLSFSSLSLSFVIWNHMLPGLMALSAPPLFLSHSSSPSLSLSLSLSLFLPLSFSLSFSPSLNLSHPCRLPLPPPLSVAISLSLSPSLLLSLAFSLSLTLSLAFSLSLYALPPCPPSLPLALAPSHSS